MKTAKKLLIAISGLLVLITVSGFWILPAVLKPFLTEKISEALHRRASIAQIEINPFDLSVTIEGFQLAEPDKKTPFFSFDRLRMNVDVPTSLYRRALILEEISLEKPYLGITRKEDGSYNFSDLIPKQEAQKEKSSETFLFSLNNIRISGGNIDFHDRPRQTDHRVRELQLSVPFLSNIDYYMKNYVEPRFSAVINGHFVKAVGKTQPFHHSRDTSLTLDIKNIDIPFYLQYSPVKMNFRLSEARMDTRLEFHFLLNEKKAPQMKLTGRLDLRKVRLEDLQRNKILLLPALSIDIASVEPFVPKIHLTEISLDAPQLFIRRNKKGVLNLLELAATDGKNPAAKKDPKNPPNDSGKKNKMPDVRVDRLRIERADISIMDAVPTRPVHLQIAPLRLYLSGFSLRTQSLADIDLAMTLKPKTEIVAKGPVFLAPLSAELALNVKNLLLRTFQPYFPPNVQMDVLRGSLSTTGQLLLKTDAKSKPGVLYRGKMTVADLTIIDRVHQQNFLKWKTMSVSSLQAGYNPLFVKIQEIAFSDVFAKMVIHAGGRTNIEDIFGAPQKEMTQTKETTLEKIPEDTRPYNSNPTTAQTPGSPLPPPDITIAKVRFSGGTIDFADDNIRPNYAVTLRNLRGGVTGLSSLETSRAKVDVKGNLGYGSPIDIAGTINPLKNDLFADVKISFKDIEMTPVTPYTSKYLGYPITKGKLTFNVSYLVDKRKLTAENRIFFDQLTFGNQVDSPDAIQAPVPLAVALLTDRKGQINLNIPLTGSLDDPKFRIWPIVWQVLKNLIVKAVTAPFALLSSLTGGGEEMSYLEFEYGSAKLTDEGQKKVGALVRALYDRPHVKLEIEGYVDPAQDAEALKKDKFQRLLKQQKFKDLIGKEENPGQGEEISILPTEYEKYLTLAYETSKFSKPRTVLGLTKKLPATEMEKLLQSQISVSENDLIALASRRATSVREQLLLDGKIEPGRVFLVKASAPAPGKKEKVKNSRVEFKIK